MKFKPFKEFQDPVQSLLIAIRELIHVILAIKKIYLLMA